MGQPISRRSALAALLLIAPAASVGVAVALAGARGPTAIAAWMLAKVWLFGLPLFWLIFVDRLKPSFSKPTHGGFGVSIVLGLVMAGAIVGGYLLFGRGVIDPQQLRGVLEPLHLTNRVVYLGAATYWVCVNSVLEEYVFRWFIFTRAERLMPSGAAVVLSAVIFVVHHTIAMSAYLSPGLNAIASLGIFVAALIWSSLYERYRSVWVAWVAHACADVAIFAIGWSLLFS